MKFNGTIFSKPQQDQLKEVIGKEVEKVVEKVNDVDARMLNYTGDWVTGNEYHENDVVTWANDGNLYEVIKAHTSSASIDPSNTEYYKAMTNDNAKSTTFQSVNKSNTTALTNIINIIYNNKETTRAVNAFVSQLDGINMYMSTYNATTSRNSCALVGMRRNSSTYAFELCYLLISTLSGQATCKYSIFNAETMEFIKSGEYSGTIIIYT